MFLNSYRYILMFCVFLQNFCDGNNMRWEEDLYFSALKHYCTKKKIYIYIFYHHVLLKAPEQNSLSLTLLFLFFLRFVFLL